MIKKSMESLMALTSSLTPISQRSETFDVNSPLETGVAITTKRIQDKLQFTQLQTRIKELEEAKSGVLTIPVNSITPNPWQPRRTFDVTDLVSSITEAGLIQPIIVRKHPSSIGQYQLVAGERRLRACTELGWTEIAAVELANLADADMAVLALTENVTRNDLSDFEVGACLGVIQREFPSKKTMAEALGVSRSELYRLMSFEALPEFVLADLRSNPSLLGANAAGGLSSILKQHGTTAETKLEPLWLQLKEGKLDQRTLLAKLQSEINHPAALRPLANSKAFFKGSRRVGRIKDDGKNYIINIKADAISPEQAKQITDLITTFFP
jgi:ParB family chromosome partitioning protein